VTGSALDEVDFEYATSVAEKAMRAMAEQRVPPTANNFQVWFKYTLGTSTDLQRAIDILIANKRKFDAATNHGLFSTYIGSRGIDEAAAHKASQQLHAVMTSARQFLTTAINDNRSQIQAMNDVADRSEAGVDPKSLIERLMTELAQATTRAEKLEASFVEKTRELDTIRDSLSKSEERPGPTR
jgi:diguanylate cyclase